MTPEQLQERETRLRKAFIDKDFGEAGASLDDSAFAGVEDRGKFLMSGAVAGWAGSMMGQRVNPAAPDWQGIKDGIARGYFKTREASNVSDEDLFNRIAEDYKAQDALADSARNAAARGESWLGKFREVEEKMPNVAGGRQSPYLGLARQVHDSFRAKILPYQSTIRSVAEKAKNIETSAEGMDWSGMAQELIQVPKESRPFVLEAISRQATANVDANTAEKLGKEFARGFERFLDTAMSGVESMGESAPGQFLRQSYGFDVEAMTPEQREQRAQFMDLRDDIRNISTGKLAKLDDVRLIGMNVSGAVRNVPMTIGAFVPYVGPAALLGSFQRETANELRRSNPTMSRADVEQIATISAPFQAITEVVSDRLLFGKLPNLKRLFTAPVFSAGGVTAQLAARTTIGTATEFGEELAQGVIPKLVQSLKSDVPDVDWEGYFEDFKNQSPELIATILPLALFGAGVGQVSDYRASVQMLQNADEMMAAKIPAEEARKIAELATSGKRPEAESMFRQEFRKAATKGEAPAEMQAAAQRVIAASQAQRQVEEVNSKEAENLGVRVFRDAQGWKVETAAGTVVNADSAEAARRIRDDIQTSATEYEAETMTALVDDLVTLQPQTRVELRPEVAAATSEGIEFTNPITGKTTKIADAKSFQNLRDQAAAVDGSQSDAPRLILGDNYFEFAQGIARVFRRERGPQSVPQMMTAAHEVIENSFRRGLVAGQWTEQDAKNAIGSIIPALESGILKLGAKATAEEKSWLDNAKRAVAEGDSNLVREVISELGVRTWIGRDRDGNKTGLRPGTILRALDAAILQEAKPENVTTYQRLRAWFKAVGAYLKGVVATAKIIRDAERNGTIDDFTGFLDKVLGIEAATREENEAKQDVQDMAFSLAPEMQSRAKPQAIAPVVEMPDGARLVGPSTFSIQAYHGTPHKVDKFTTAKIGTGEGAQAYGWGLYFAQSREVGEMYRDAVSDAKKERLPKLREKLKFEQQFITDAPEGYQTEGQWKADKAEALANIAKIEKQISNLETGGNLYTVELLPDEDEFLDWDKPLSEQSEKVRTALASYKPDVKSVTGSQVYMDFEFNEGDEQKASTKLASIGIPGIRYLDAGSRGSGDGTRNFVIFDESLVKILEENGKPVGSTFSLSPQSGIDIVSDTLESWQGVFDAAAKRNPTRAMAIRDLAQQRINKLGDNWASDRWTAKGDKVRAVVEKRTAKSLDSEQAFRFRSRQRELIDQGMMALTPETQAAYDAGVRKLDDDPLVSMMLNDHGKLMSKSSAEEMGKDIADLYDDKGWIPPQWYAATGGITPDVMANNLGFETASQMWAALDSSIKSARSANEAFNKAAQAVRDVKQSAEKQAREESAAWRQESDDMQADDWSPRESLVRDMRVLNVALSAFPAEVRAKVTGGSMVKLAGLATERARYKAIKTALDRAIVEAEKFMRKEYSAMVKATFAKYEPDAKSGDKPKGKLGADVQEIFDAAKAALGLSAEQTQAELARLDSLIAADGITPEQELNLTRQRGLVELLGDWKNADSGRMAAALEALEDTLSEGWASWKLRQILIREGREESRKELRAGTKKKGLGKERDAMRDEAATTLGKASSSLLNLSSFSDVMKYAFGAVGKAKEFINRERIASNAYEDAIQAIGDRIQDFFTSLGGGSVIAGERIRYDLAHQRISVGSGDSERNLTQMQGIQALLMWQQEDGRRHMEGPKDENGQPIEGKWSYDEAWIADLESKLTPEAKSAKLFLQQLYSEEWAPLNAIYREIHGINLPRHDLYAPLTVKPQQAKAGEMVDPVSGAAIAGSILTPGSLRSRNRTAQAEPDFRDALAVFLGHSKQMEHWKNYYNLAVDLSAVLGNREVMNAVEASIGSEGVTVLRKWIDAIAQGGFRDAAAQMEISQIMSRLAGRAATVALLGRVSTLLVQSTQLAAASVRMPVGAYLKRFGKLMSGNLGWGDAIKSDFIQRRIKQAPPIVRQAMSELGTASRPNAITASLRILGNLLSGADGIFTGGTYAILLDWHRTQGAKMGMGGAELEAYAHDMAATITEEVAQPVRMANRSLMEIANTGPMARVSWAYSSEARQKIALFFWSAKTAKSDPAKFGKTAFLTFIVGGLVSQVIKNLWREAKGDDDEKKWSAERLTAATLAGPLHGIPLASEIMGNPGQLSSIAWSKAALEDVFTGDANMQDVETLLSVLGYFNDNLAGISSLSHLGFDFAKIINAATEGEK